MSGAGVILVYSSSQITFLEVRGESSWKQSYIKNLHTVYSYKTRHMLWTHYNLYYLAQISELAQPNAIKEVL